MMSVLAFVRPDEWNFVLFLHILGALVLIGALTLTAASLAAAWHNGSEPMLRLGFRSLLWAALPAWVVMRVGAQLILDKEYPGGDPDIAWINIGFSVAEPGFLLILIATLLSWLGIKRTKETPGTGLGLDRAATVLIGIALLAYLVAIWAMSTKPT